MSPIRLLVLLLCVLEPGQAFAQDLPELFGPARDIARSELIYPTVLDPLIALPLTPAPQAMIDVPGRDVSTAFQLGVRAGDNNYGLTFSTPLSRSDSTTVI